MKHIKYLILLVPIFVSCHKNDLKTRILPECITELIELDSSLKIQIQEVNSETHFWLNTGAININGSEFIVNEQCDTVCFFPFGFMYLECLNDYNGSWDLIWP